MIKLIDGYFLTITEPHNVYMQREVPGEEPEYVGRFPSIDVAVLRAKDIIANARIRNAGDISLEEAEMIVIRTENDIENLRYNPERLFYTE